MNSKKINSHDVQGYHSSMTALKTIQDFAAWLASIEIWLMSLVVGLSIISERFLVFCVILGVCFWFVRWIATGHPCLSTPIGAPVLVLLLILLISSFITPPFEVSLIEKLRLLTGILLFFSVINWATSPQRLSWMLWGTFGVAILLAISAILMVSWVNKFRFLPALLPSSVISFLGEAVHPNVMAGILLLFIAGILAWFVFVWGQVSRLQRIELITVIFCMMIIFGLTQSRGALIALAIAVILLTLLRFKRSWILVVIGGVVAVTLIFQIGPEKIWRSVGVETGGISTFNQREEIWLRAILIIRDFPLTGIGIGNFRSVTDYFYPFSSTLLNVDHAHNLFLQIAIDLGLPGLITWLACWFTILGMAWQLYRKGEGRLRALGAAILCSQTALGVHGLIDCVTWNTRPAVIVWVIWGITVAAWLQLRRATAGEIRCIS
jgi:putative inorganic carbon (HCO3(-)) transporter